MLICNALSSWGLITRCLYNILLFKQLHHTVKNELTAEFLISLRQSVMPSLLEVLSLSAYTTLILKHLHNIVKNKLTEEFLIPMC